MALKEDVGESIPNAVLLIDTTALLAALKEKIEKAKAGDLTLNRQLADAIVGKIAWPAHKLEPVAQLGAEQLNPSQRRAYEHSLSDPIVFIWGPPGCGKTETLSEIVKATLKANILTFLRRSEEAIQKDNRQVGERIGGLKRQICSMHCLRGTSLGISTPKG